MQTDDIIILIGSRNTAPEGIDDVRTSARSIIVERWLDERMSEKLLIEIITKLNGIDGRLDKMDTRFGQVETRLDKMDTRFDQVETRLDKMDTRFDQIETRLDKIDTRFDQMETTMNVRFERLEIKLDAISEQVARNTENESSFNELAVTVARHTTDINLLKKLAAI
jgi:archaellum component FlaC